MGNPQKYTATVFVRLKKGLLDPQGKAVHSALDALGFDHIASVRVGKLIDIKLSAPGDSEAQKILEQMSRQLLANPVIEDFQISLHPHA